MAIWNKEYIFAGWPTPIILATQKAEIRRITVQSQTRQIVQRTLLRKRAGGVA
jgi:hypothetical protein